MEKQNIYLKDRYELECDGVTDVRCFYPDYIELTTSLGILTVEGENMKIEELIKETGRILIKGDICGVAFKKQKVRKKLFGDDK